MPLDRAARVGDPIEHTQAEGWGLGMALPGALAAAAIVLTAPISVPAMAAVATVSGAALIGKGIGENIGAQQPVSAAGYIVDGAATVFTGPGVHKAARMSDPVDCHEGKKIADGSDSVFIEGWNASRRKDETWCAGKIEDGSPTVEIGGNTIGQAGSEARTELSEGYQALFKVVEVVNTVSSFGAKEGAEEIALFSAGLVANYAGQSNDPRVRQLAVAAGAVIDAVSLVRGKPSSQWSRRDYVDNVGGTVGRVNDAYGAVTMNEPPRTYTIRQ